MTKGTGGFFFTNPNHTGILGTSTFSTSAPNTTPKTIPSQCTFVVLGQIRMIRFSGYALAG